MSSLVDARSFIEELARGASEMALQYREKLSSLEIERKTAKEVVTEADKGIELYIREKIFEKYPDHSLLGEEYGQEGKSEYLWVIDPIDGTNSFVHNIPFFSVSIGLQFKGETILGAVAAPVLNEFFIAEKGKGATLNGQSISVSKLDNLSKALLATGFACLRSDVESNNLPYFGSLVPKIGGIRRMGSAALDLAYVACGRMDGFWELHLNIYDIAAGVLLVEEAGGKATDFSGDPYDPSEVLVTNGILHKDIVDVFEHV